MSRSRFQTFVALRYLMAHPRRASRMLLMIAAASFLVGAALWTAGALFLDAPDPRSLVPGDGAARHNTILAGKLTVGFGGFILYVFAVRYFFTFYSTVSILGVSVGCAALVIVLSVMNGFEADLRSKILGSNAHVQVTKEEGDFTEWEDVRARIDQVRGVAASTPFATSEVVVAANSNYVNVVIKGIDVKSAVKVTALQKNLIDPEALSRLDPLVVDEAESPIVAPEPDPAGGGGEVLDPAPDDMEGGGAPIDYSDPDDPPAAPILDPAPADFADGARVGEGDPTDFSGDLPDEPILRDPRPGEPGGPPRNQRVDMLPGVLVGRELVKQIHLYTRQEVRLVSPLADPMNPDANGTPIPFNRDYRVAGEFFTGMYEYDLKLVYVSLESLQRFLRLGDAVDGIEVRLADADDVDTAVARLQAQLGPAYRVVGWKELNRNLFSALKLEKIAMFLVLAIIILVASFSIVGTLIMTVVEKARQIALLKTLGASDTGIVLVFVIQGTLIGLIGGALGVLIGLGGCWFLGEVGFAINADVYYISQLPVSVDPMVVVLVFVAALIISFAATIYPSILGAQLRPAVGLKKS